MGTNECCLKNALPAFATQGRRRSMLAFGESSAMQLAPDTQLGGTHKLAMGHELRIQGVG
jgi:hypothetical protein